jgi:hypothetical protein
MRLGDWNIRLRFRDSIGRKLVSRFESSTEMPGAALRRARGTLRAHPPRRPMSALPAALLAYRSTDMRAALLAGALTSAADAAIFRRTSEAGH